MAKHLMSYFLTGYCFSLHTFNHYNVNVLTTVQNYLITITVFNFLQGLADVPDILWTIERCILDWA